jgi:hypothetical protein
MASKGKDIELIEQYLDGLLAGKDLEEFKERRKSDPEFNRQVEEMSLVINGIRESARNSLMEELKELEASLPEVVIDTNRKGTDNVIELGSYKIRKLYWRATQYVALAASLAGIFFGLARPYYQFAQNPDQYRRYQTPPENLELASFRGEASKTITYDEAEKAFKQEKFGKTISLLKDVDEKSEAEWMMLGNSYFQKKRFRKAAECFDLNHFKEGSELLDDAKFSLALSYIALAKDDKARSLLGQIAISQSSYSFDAQNVIKTLNED